MGTVELRFGALPVHVRTARLLAAALARRTGVEESLIDEVKLAIGEACSRAVDVHRRHVPAELVTVVFDDGDDVFRVTVLDAGPIGEQVAAGGEDRPGVLDLLVGIGSIWPGSADGTGDGRSPGSGSTGAVDDPAMLLPSGLGLALIEGLVDDVTIATRPEGVGTRVTMSWAALGELPDPHGDDGDLIELPVEPAAAPRASTRD